MPAAPRLAVAASGGRDSTALLHCTMRLAAPLGVEVLALHVHHGLHPQAGEWLTHVQRQSRRWGIGFDSRRLPGSPAAGQSVEAWARLGRYAALAEMAQAHGCCCVLLAQHRRDQAETVLLQALRGGGPRGVAAMPKAAERAGVLWLRPWLEQPRSAIDVYLRRHRLGWVDDPGNADTRFARNRLRHTVWPALSHAFPDADAALAQAARRAHEAAELALECAAVDLPTLDAGGGNLDVAAWQRLSPARRRNALRSWLQTRLPGPVPDTLVRRLDRELPSCRRTARWPAGSQELRLGRGVLFVVALSGAGDRLPKSHA